MQGNKLCQESINKIYVISSCMKLQPESNYLKKETGNGNFSAFISINDDCSLVMETEIQMSALP